jgi:hypothetical protein
MPIPENAWSIFRHTLVRDSSAKRNAKSHGLFPSIGLRILAGVQTVNSDRSGRRAREGKLLLEDVELAEWDCKEHAVVCTGYCLKEFWVSTDELVGSWTCETTYEGDESPKVLSRRL